MKKGNINSPMKLLTDNMKNDILRLKGQTLNQIQLKQPEGKEASQKIMLADRPESIHPIKLERFEVEKTSVKIQGGSRPSGMDAGGCKQKLTSKQKLHCRITPLHKDSGLWPIGIGEVLLHIAGKVILTHVWTEIVISVGSPQVCAGQEAGCESIKHAMHPIYED